MRWVGLGLIFLWNAMGWVHFKHRNIKNSCMISYATLPVVNIKLAKSVVRMFNVHLILCELRTGDRYISIVVS